MRLSVYDQPDGLVVTDGVNQIYIDESDFDQRNDLMPIDDEIAGAKPDYVKKVRLVEGEVYPFEDISPKSKMIILEYQGYARNSYVYDKKKEKWLFSSTGEYLSPDGIREDFKFKVLFLGEK